MRFLMVTGVSKFAKTSIFSAFNNPYDLSLDARAADLLGYTHEEMEAYFHEHISAFADANGETYEQAFAELLRWYDGYQFSPNKAVKVVNPVSLGRALAVNSLGNYWEATAGSTVALLYQGGYLTIDRRIDGETVALRVPNEEVRSSLYRGYMSSLFGTDFELDDFAMTAKETARELVVDELGAKFTELLRTALPTGAALSTSASTTIPPSARSTWSRPSKRTDDQVCRGSSVQRSF